MWPFSTPKTMPLDSLLSICFSEDGIALAHAVKQKFPQESEAPFVVSEATFIPCEDPSQREFLLNRYLSERHLKFTQTAVVLPSSDYRLLLLDRPNVPEEELKQSAKWLVRDLVDYALDDVAIDVFPAPVVEGKKPKIFITVTRKSALQNIARLLDTVHLPIVRIDIGELALRNLAMLVDGAEDGVLMIHPFDSQLQILIQCADTIYLSRLIDNPFVVQSEEDLKRNRSLSKKKDELKPQSSVADAEEKLPSMKGNMTQETAEEEVAQPKATDYHADEQSMRPIGSHPSKEPEIPFLRSLSGQIETAPNDLTAGSTVLDSVEDKLFSTDQSNSSPAEETAWFDKKCTILAQELQRSVDFYQSQIGRARPVKVLVTEALEFQEHVMDCLRDSLDIPIEQLNVEQLLTIQTSLEPQARQQCLTVLGELFCMQDISV